MLIEQAIPRQSFVCVFGFLLLLVGGYFLFSSGARPKPPSGLVHQVVGNPKDKRISGLHTHVLLMGGGTDLTRAFSAFAFPLLRGGNVLVLRESGGMGYNTYFAEIARIGDISSVETIVVDSREIANSNYVAWCIRHAEVIWLAGGNQTATLAVWKETRLQRELQAAIDRGVVIGGTSSGLSILSSRIYAPPSSFRGITGPEALEDPFNMRMSLEPAFVRVPILGEMILDGHILQRDRLGRCLAILARELEEQPGQALQFLGIDEQTAVFVYPDGCYEVISQVPEGQAVHLMPTRQTERRVVRAGHPLDIRHVGIRRLYNGDRGLVSDWRTEPEERVSVFGDMQLRFH